MMGRGRPENRSAGDGVVGIAGDHAMLKIDPKFDGSDDARE